MVTTNDVQNLLDGKAVVFDRDGEKVGKLAQVFLDDRTSEPEWATVNTGLFGTGESFVPLAGATISGEELHVQFEKDVIKDSPRVDADTHLDENEEIELFRYYGLDRDRQAQPTAVDDDTSHEHRGTRDEHDNGVDASGPSTDDAMTRSEERLNVGTERHETGRVHLRKHIVTENVTTTVPVQREEVRLEREPITDANRGAAESGADLTEEDHVATLHEERVVVNKETVPVERVRLEKDVVTENQQVSEDVRKEQIETDLPDGAGRSDRDHPRTDNA